MDEIEKPKFVAQKDGAGRVTEVFLSLPNPTYPRKDAKGDALEDILAAGEFHGASKGEISDWLTRKWQGVA